MAGTATSRKYKPYKNLLYPHQQISIKKGLVKVEQPTKAPFQQYMNEYRKQLEKGSIKAAYRGLMDYMNSLRAHFTSKCPDYFVSGLYFGYMDMTYFALIPKSLKRRKLKIAIVFNHEAFRFEAWLSGYNKAIQAKYWKQIKQSSLSKYRQPASTKGADSIVECDLVENPDFGDLDALTRQIESGTLKFIGDVEGFLSEA